MTFTPTTPDDYDHAADVLAWGSRACYFHAAVLRDWQEEPTAPALDLGWYGGNGSQVHAQGGRPLTDHETLIGRSVDLIADFVPAEDITLTSWSPLWHWTQLSPAREALVVGVPLQYETPLDDYRTLAGRLAEGTIVRLGWEMNGKWYRGKSRRWSTSGRDGRYANKFREIVVAMREANPTLRFCWNPTLGQQWPQGEQFDPEAAWPGDEYVDIVGIDVYDNRWAPHQDDEHARWSHLRDQEHGLNFWVGFAAQHGKPLCLPEYATELDSAVFVENMVAYAIEHSFEFAVYWDFNAGDVNSSLASNPAARATYVAAVGALSDG